MRAAKPAPLGRPQTPSQALGKEGEAPAGPPRPAQKQAGGASGKGSPRRRSRPPGSKAQVTLPRDPCGPSPRRTEGRIPQGGVADGPSPLIRVGESGRLAAGGLSQGSGRPTHRMMLGLPPRGEAPPAEPEVQGAAPARQAVGRSVAGPPLGAAGKESRLKGPQLLPAHLDHAGLGGPQTLDPLALPESATFPTGTFFCQAMWPRTEKMAKPAKKLVTPLPMAITRVSL